MASVSKNVKAAGPEGLSGHFLKDRATFLTKPIIGLCSLSINSEKFPDSCKVAKLRSLYKKGSLTQSCNYRPISLLPLISKVIEKVIHDLTSTFLNSKKLLYICKSGFRKKHSTDFCLSYLNDKILKGFDKVLMTGMILIDLQKAFDTNDHDVLLQKLYAAGFSKHTVNWFQFYLSNRSFLVNLENSFSQLASASCGVPQDPILGPLLFLIYVIGMSLAAQCDLFLYADDTCLVCSMNKNQLNEYFCNTCVWFVDNKQSIHFREDKAKSILFAFKFKRKII